MNKKICMVTSSFPRYPSDPAGIFIYNLAKWLSKKGLHIDIAAPHHQGCKLQERRDGFNIYRFPYFFPFAMQKLSYGSGIMKNISQHPPLGVLVPFFLLSEIIGAYFIAKRFNADILHAHWTIPQGLPGVLCKKLLKIPLITTVHGSDVFSFRNSSLNGLNKWIIRNSDICTVNSSATAKTVSSISPKSNISVIPMGVDTSFFQPMNNNSNHLKIKFNILDKTILYVGRLIDWKGVDSLIRALQIVLLKFPTSKLWIVGEGPEKYRLEHLAKVLSIRNNVIFTGKLSQQEIVNYYQTADVFVLPSIVNEAGETEGLGVVLLEAMACGVPVIGSNVGGIGDIVKNETTGLLVPPKNPGKLADSIIRLFEDKELKTTLMDNGRRFVETRFSWDVVSDRFIQLYNTFLTKKTDI